MNPGIRLLRYRPVSPARRYRGGNQAHRANLSDLADAIRTVGAAFERTLFAVSDIGATNEARYTLADRVRFRVWETRYAIDQWLRDHDWMLPVLAACLLVIFLSAFVGPRGD